MIRKFFNGISSIELNGNNVSFTLEDNYTKNGIVLKESVGTFITDLETFSGVVNFLATQEKSIRESLKKEDKSKTKLAKQENPIEKNKPTLSKISTVNK